MAVASSEREAREVWERVVDLARDALPEATIAMWFADVRAARLHEGILDLVVPSDLVRERLQRNHLRLIEETASAVIGQLHV